MGKSIEKTLKKEMKKLHVQLMKAEDNISELYDIFDQIRFIAGCRSCEKEKEYSNLLFMDRYTSCRSEGPCKSVSEIAAKIKDSEQKEKKIREEYGAKLFDILKEFNPAVICLKDRSITSWDKVFGSCYSRLSEDDKVSLIALVEFDGGMYRLKDVPEIFRQ